MMQAPAPATAPSQSESIAGFTLVELLIYMVISLVVLGSIYQLLINQTRGYTRQREVLDARESVRSAGILLTSEFRSLSAAEGDLYSINPTSVILRSTLGSAIVCAKHPSQLRLGLWRITGDIRATPLDSALLYAVNEATSNDDEWRVVDLTGTADAGAWGVPTCEWPTAPPTEQVVAITADTAGVALGATLRAFRQVEYKIFEEDGRWWLGRKEGASGTLQKLTGPLLAPADGGLTFEYLDAAGTPTTDRFQVSAVQIAIRSESYGKARFGATKTPQVRKDSAIVRVKLRG